MYALHFHPIQLLEEKILGSFPMIERVVSLFLDRDKEVYISELGEKIKIAAELLQQVQVFRTKTVPYTWIQEESVPFFNTEKLQGQLSLGNETNHRILVLLLPAAHAGLKDLLFIKFPANSKFFGIQKELAAFTTDEKIIVAELFHKLFSYDLNNIQHYQKQATLAQKFNQFNQQAHNTLLQSNESFRTFFKEVVGEYLEELSTELRTTLLIEEEALSILSDISSNLHTLRLFLNETAQLAVYLNPHLESVTLTVLHINTIASEPSKLEVVDRNNDSKIIDLLDKYEAAAAKANQSGYPINGKYVAQFCSPPISPPAVSDSLKKYSSKIQVLLKANPKQWLLIRKSLKPLRDLSFDSYRNDSLAM